MGSLYVIAVFNLILSPFLKKSPKIFKITGVISNLKVNYTANWTLQNHAKMRKELIERIIQIFLTFLFFQCMQTSGERFEKDVYHKENEKRGNAFLAFVLN